MADSGACACVCACARARAWVWVCVGMGLSRTKSISKPVMSFFTRGEDTSLSVCSVRMLSRSVRHSSSLPCFSFVLSISLVSPCRTCNASISPTTLMLRISLTDFFYSSCPPLSSDFRPAARIVSRFVFGLDSVVYFYIFGFFPVDDSHHILFPL